jgi:hypothetical protein
MAEIQTINSFYLEKEEEFSNLFATRYQQEVKDMARSFPLLLFLLLLSSSVLFFLPLLSSLSWKYLKSNLLLNSWQIHLRSLKT